MAVAASEAVGFTPAERPRVAIAYDGTLASIHEPTRISILELPSGAPFAEVGVDREAGATDVAWLGAPPRLIVLSRFAAHSTVHLVDPYGPRTIAEIRLESPMRLFATAGAHALAVGAQGAAILTAGDAHLAPYQFPARTMPVAAGAAAGQMVVALSGSIEEWDPQTRMPKRRLKLPRPATITAVGGSDRVVWMTTQQDPTRVDVLPLVNRGQPKWHELPEPIAFVAAHPRSDLIACVGADSGRMYVVDLDGRQRMRTVAADGIERVEAAALVVGRLTGVLAAQARRRIAVVPLDGREVEEAISVAAAAAAVVEELEPPPKRSTLGADEDPAAEEVRGDTQDEQAAEETSTSTSTSAEVESAPVQHASPAPGPSLFRAAAGPVAVPPRAPPKPVAVSAQSLTDRFSAWRERTRAQQPRSDGVATQALPGDPRPSWRDDVVAWSRAVTAGAPGVLPSAPPIDALLDRFDVPSTLLPALVYLYGAHLAGENGAAPVDVARVLGRRWDEALGRGLLAMRRLATFPDAGGCRVRLASAVQRALDELPPVTGTLVGEPGPITLLGPCCVVADGALVKIAEHYQLSLRAAVLAAHEGFDEAAILLEARAFGAVALYRPHATAEMVIPAEPAILVVSDEVAADALGLPRL